jgi:hypothetical protein
MGMAACCTGVVFTKPMASTAPRIHSDSAGVRALNARSTLVCGAISHEFQRPPVRCGFVKRDAQRCARTFAGTKKVEARSDWPAPPQPFRVGAAGGACHCRHMRCVFGCKSRQARWMFDVELCVLVLSPGTPAALCRDLHMQADLAAKPDLVDRHWAAPYSHDCTPISCLSHNKTPA